MKRFRILFSVFFMLVSLTALGQNITVKGNVTDAKTGEAIPFVAIQIKGTSTGGSADVNGSYSISVPSKGTLIFSFLGYANKEVAVEGKTVLNVSLEPDTETLESVVVTGMQVTDRRLFTGASAKIDAGSTKLDGVSDISRSLEGRAAGVTVQNVSGTFGTAPKIRVRGATSIFGSSKPLWVVDGVIMEDVVEVDSDDLSSGDAETLISSAIAGLNADDIESFDILKDGSATSIYGARAMAGVIVVTTKKGKAGTDKISYTGEFTTRLKPSYSDFNIMNSQEQMGIYKELEANGLLNFSSTYRASESGVYGKMYQLLNKYNPETGTFALANTQEAINNYLRAAEYRNTDWFGILFSNSLSQNHSISLQSGSDKAQYYVSMSIMNDPGWTLSSNVNRYTGNVNANFNIFKKLSLNLITNASYRKQKAPGTASQSVNAVTGEVSRDFDINPYSYALNTSRTLDPEEYYTRNYAPFNIRHELQNNYMNIDVADIRFQGELKYKPTKQLTIAALAAYKYSNSVQKHVVTENANQAMAFRAMDDATMRDNNGWLYTDPDRVNSLPESVLPYGGFYRESKYTMNNWSVRATAAYNNTFAQKHIVNIFGGTEINSLDRERSFFNGVGMQYDMGEIASFDYRYFKMMSEENTQYYTLVKGRTRETSFFANATYSYMGRYTINGTARYEGTNRMGRSRSARWIPTWNISGAWNVHEENWFAELEPLSHLTFKASYSLTADRGPSWVTNSMAVISSTNPWRPFTDVKESALELEDLENSELTYEKKHEFNFGFDLGMWDNRVSLAFDVYSRNNFDLIGPVTTMGIGGFVTKYGNIAAMKSSGQEISLTTKNIDNKNFKWTTNVIFSHNKNEVTKLEADRRIIDMVNANGFTKEGYPVRSLFSVDFKGLTDHGTPKIVDEYGDVVSSITSGFFQSRTLDYLVYEGPSEPTFNGSIGNTFSWKGVRLNVFITYSGGNKLRLDQAFFGYYTDLDAMPREFSNRWTVAGDEQYTNIPAIVDRRERQQNSTISYIYNAYNRSSARVADGGFVRMKEISLSYDLPQSFVKKIKLSNVNLKVQATNLFLIYSDPKLNGQDPEFFNSGGVAVPMPKQFTFTIRLGI